jgi:transcriptional regulator with XRE-family HTH domain
MVSRSTPGHDTPSTLSFGARMRYERERRNISIAAIAENTKILGALLEGLENDDVSRWPTGLYRRAFMRAYATAIGLDPDATVKEFLERFPDPEVTAAPLASQAPPAGGVVAPAPPAPAATVPVVNRRVRVALPELGAWFSEGCLLRGFRQRCLAAAVDLFMLVVLGLAMYAVLGTLWAPLCVAAAAYYGGGILLLGNTPGVCFFADPEKTLGKRGRLHFNWGR